jgi:hypothetical protein
VLLRAVHVQFTLCSGFGINSRGVYAVLGTVGSHIGTVISSGQSRRLPRELFGEGTTLPPAPKTSRVRGPGWSPHSCDHGEQERDPRHDRPRHIG